MPGGVTGVRELERLPTRGHRPNRARRSANAAPIAAVRRALRPHGFSARCPDAFTTTLCVLGDGAAILR